MLGREQIVNVHSTEMDDDSCVLKYIEIIPLENNADQFEDLKPFQVKVCIIANEHVYSPKQQSTQTERQTNTYRYINSTSMYKIHTT